MSFPKHDVDAWLNDFMDHALLNTCQVEVKKTYKYTPVVRQLNLKPKKRGTETVESRLALADGERLLARIQEGFEKHGFGKYQLTNNTTEYHVWHGGKAVAVLK